MELLQIIPARNWAGIAGYLLFTGMMSIGYFYKVTFVQQGLVDLGLRVLGMSRAAVAGQLAVLALVTAVIALLTGLWMQRNGWSAQLRRKSQLAGGDVWRHLHPLSGRPDPISGERSAV